MSLGIEIKEAADFSSLETKKDWEMDPSAGLWAEETS